MSIYVKLTDSSSEVYFSHGKVQNNHNIKLKWIVWDINGVKIYLTSILSKRSQAGCELPA